MHALLLTLGSYGDVHPFVGIGSALRERGHRVTLLTNDHFRSLAESHGLEFVPVGTARQYHAIGQNLDLWHARRGAPTILKVVRSLLKDTYEALAASISADTVVVASTLGLAARITQEKLGTPLVTAHLAPFMFRSLHAPPRLPGMFPLEWLPKGVQRLFWSGMDRYLLDRLLAPAINELRGELGLPGDVSGVMDQWWHSPERVLGLWPAWFGDAAPDWPQQVRLCGFPLYDERKTAAVSPKLAAFLEAGDPPVAFTPGSAMQFGDRFFGAAVDACRRLGLRAVLLSRHEEHIPRSLTKEIIGVDFAPFSHLLPRCCALVHHGGIGTLSQGIAAGLPQVVMPMSHDQVDNSVRLQRLGVGLPLSPRRFTGRRLADRLQHLVQSDKAPAVKKTAAVLAADLKNRDGIANACDEIEGLVADSKMRLIST